MKKITPIHAVWLACLLLALGEPALAGELAYSLDPAHTETQFSWAHMGYSHPSAGFDDITGSLQWNADDIRKSSVTVSIAVASLHTRVPLLDKILVSPKYFDVAKFPRITFVSTRVEPTDHPDHYRVTGDLSVHGISKPVVLEVTLNKSDPYPMFNFEALGFDASTSFKRSDFGLGEGVPFVSDEIRVQITTEAWEAKGYAKAKPTMDAMAAKAAAEAAQSGKP